MIKNIRLPIFFFMILKLFFLNSVLSASAKPSSRPQKLSLDKDLLVLVPTHQAPEFKDDGDLNDLKKAILSSMQYYQTVPANTLFDFGKDHYDATRLIFSLEHLLKFLDNSPSPNELNNFIRKEYLIYRSVGLNSSREEESNIIFSAYHEYSLKASLSKSSEYRYPIYSRPPDLIDVYLENFDPQRKGERIVGRVEGNKLVPYYTRKDIDSGKILKDKDLEIAWAKDPLDILFLQIQGSGWIKLPQSTETYHVRYAGDNGRAFRSVGTYLIESKAIPKDKFSRSIMIEYLSKLSEEQKRNVLNQNPRYVFFEIVSSTHLTRGSLLVPLTAGRSIASDPHIYPPASLSWIKTKKPVLNEQGQLIGNEPISRFVLNQDEGGAIKGPSRIDFFWGGGEQAERVSQKLWYPGELYFFVKKIR